jgi:hypothetical protein|nr:MAG TPA_asm: hypothetical protein [Caudoviricetes sp.]
MPALTISLIGLMTWNETLLTDNLHVPSGIDVKTIADFIVYDCAELEVYISNPDVLGDAINKWSTVMLPYWENVYKTEKEMKEISTTAGKTETYTRENTRTPDIVVSSQINNTINDNDTYVKAVAGFNSDTTNVAEKNTSNSETSHDTNSDTTTSGHEKINEKITRTYTDGVQGLKAWTELEYANTMMKICEDFKERFCLLIY